MAARILLIRLKVIGDIILTLPAVNCVRAAYPDAHITFLTSREYVSLLGGFAAVNEVLTLDRQALRAGGVGAIWEFLRLLRRLRTEHFDLVIDLQGYGETAWLTRWANATDRWGRPSRASRRWAYTRALPSGSLVHPAAAHLELLHHCGLPTEEIRNQFKLPESSETHARALFAVHGLDLARPTLFIQPFTSGAHKNWPLENYLAVGRHWRAQGVQVILGGGPAERDALRAAREEGFPVVAGAPILVTAGVLAACTVVLGGDTGMVHLAVALGRRVVMLMHLARPDSPAPFQHPDWVITAPRAEAIAEIPMAEVNAALAPLLVPTPTPPAGSVGG